ncbi:LysR family transcriptional regulator [Muricoccus radiodurans]|uniref:LysR family transcriptional regulator n=1 Tax=Muricoccus radiodurans TaxID=2231721 RepID=UPI003CF1345A
MRPALKLRELELFRAVMTSGTVSGAARTLQLSQPGASKLLRRLEDQIGFPLFTRSGGRLRPTVEADQLHREVEKVFRSISVVERFAQDMRLSQAGVITVACTPSLSYTLLPPAVARFRATRPNVRVWIEITTARRAVEEVGDRQVDLALVYTGEDTPRVRSRPLFQSDLVCVMPSDHRLARLRSVTSAQLADQTLIANVRNDRLSELLTSAFRSQGIGQEVMIGVNHTNAACALVREGAGLALVEDWAVGPFFPDLVRLPLRPRVRLTPRLVWSAEAPLSRVARAFAAELERAVLVRERTLSP